MIISKYNRFQVSITTIAALFFLGLGLSLLRYNNPTPKIVFGTIIIPLLSIYLLYSFFLKSPRIEFDESFIYVKGIFTSTIYSWKDVSRVQLSTQEYYSALFIFGYRMEAMKIEINNGKALIIWGDMYRNMQELRSFVVEKLNAKIHITTKRKTSLPSSIIKKRYAGNPYTSFNSLLILGIAILPSLLLSHQPKNHADIFAPMIMIIILYIGFGFQMFYFQIAGQQLVIRNHYFFWMQREYDLNDIEQVSTETPYRRSTGLRIITYQFESKFFGAGSMRDRNWSELLTDLASFGITAAKNV